PRVEDYLPEGPEAARSALLGELIPLEAEYRRRLGEGPQPEEYHRRFPALSGAWLAQALAAPAGAASPPTGARPDGRPAAGPDAPPAPPPRYPLCRSPDTQPEGLLAAGGRLGRFRLLEPVGRGAFGVVWRAQDTRLERVVALKVPHPAL